MTASVLFITYDGLLDPLGGSQILPYLFSVAEHSRPLHILSFEKADRFAPGAEAMRRELHRRGIEWTPLSFTSGAGKLGKMWDLARMYGAALHLQWRYRFRVIHCRSYQAMQVGCLLRRLASVKTLFDMRGLWVDERTDGGLWQRDRWVDRAVYALYKRIERRLLACATHVVALTHRVVPELHRLSPEMSAPVSVIPCCADFDHFQLRGGVARAVTRAGIGIPADARLIAYLGSLGTWYMLEEMLRFFASANTQWGNVHFLLVTRDWRPEHEQLLERLGVEALRDRIHVRSATRQEVPALVGAADVMLSFIKPTYSKMASSPTKLAEAFALGVPVISNAGIGDVDDITRALDAGAVVDLENQEALRLVIESLDAVCAKGGLALRERARKVLGLQVAHNAYRKVYRDLDRAP